MAGKVFPWNVRKIANRFLPLTLSEWEGEVIIPFLPWEGGIPGVFYYMRWMFPSILVGISNLELSATNSLRHGLKNRGMRPRFSFAAISRRLHYFYARGSPESRCHICSKPPLRFESDSLLNHTR